MTDRKRNFLDVYVASFLATRAAMHYEEWCATDQHDRLTTDQPIEDAVFQALETWGLYCSDKTLDEPII